MDPFDYLTTSQLIGLAIIGTVCLIMYAMLADAKTAYRDPPQPAKLVRPQDLPKPPRVPTGWDKIETTVDAWTEVDTPSIDLHTPYSSITTSDRFSAIPDPGPDRSEA